MNVVEKVRLAVDELASESRRTPSGSALARLTGAIDELTEEELSRLTRGEIGDQLVDLWQQISRLKGLLQRWESGAERARGHTRALDDRDPSGA
jgi:hypothetical protein